jgi:uncharacterized membrane protein
LSEITCRIPFRDATGERRALTAADDQRALQARLQRRERSERHAGYAIYWLFLTAPFSLGVTAVVGLLMAASQAPAAAPLNASHFRFQVGTFWGSFLGALTGGAWATIGGIASVSGDPAGGALALAGAGLAVLSGMGFYAASLFGLTRLSAREPMGRLE